MSEQINISALARNKERKKENKKEREKKRRKKERENEKKERKACCTSNYDAPYLTTTRQRGNELPPSLPTDRPTDRPQKRFFDFAENWLR